ncbi:MAG: tripartite tricarboxylate transporter TctB family protein [Treponema sp.]|nr:tripartite tricarboxylate transporter TctB family protein [Treponema sp.]
MLKSKYIRSMNDFIIGITLCAAGLYIVFTNDIVQGTANVGQAGIWIRPDVYVRFVGGLLAFFSAVLAIKAINFKKTAETTGLRFFLCRETAFTAIALVAYAFFLTRIGFAVSTFLLTFFLVCLFMKKEKSGLGKPLSGKREILKDILIAVIFSIVLVIVVWFIFSKILYVALPGAEWF